MVTHCAWFNPEFSPWFNPEFNPEFSPVFSPEFNAGFNPEFNPGFNPGYNPGLYPLFPPDLKIFIFYTEILTGKVVLWCFFWSEKIHNTTFQVKISV